MPIEPPKLEQRTFEELLREARLRIPRYCPDWTDFNDSDPGMALVQLFAWFTELMVFQYNQVPTRNHRKFLEMLNLTPRPAQPARTHVCFTPSALAKTTAIKARSRFEVPAPGGGDVLYFETTKGIDLVPHALDVVHVRSGSRFDDVTALNEKGNERFSPLGWNPQPDNALYLGFRPTEERPDFPDRITLRVFLPPPRPETRRERPRGQLKVSGADAVPLIWEYRSALDAAANVPDRWRPLTVLSDETLSFTREGTIEVRGPGPDIQATAGGRPTPDDKPRYWIRARLAGETYLRDTAPEVAMIRVNAVEVENLATFREEVLGESDGDRRRFTLRHAPVDPNSIKLELEGLGDDHKEWTRVADFFGSKRDSRHFTLNATTGEVVFGDGNLGRVPPPGGLLVAREYRAGGGAAGNVRADAINVPPAGLRTDLIDKVTNPRPAFGGSKEETVEELMALAPLALKGGDRAITREDYELMAGRVQGVARAHALERWHPDFAGYKVPGSLTVVILPDDPAKAAEPTQELLDRTKRELERVRPVGVEVHVVGPRYWQLTVRVSVVPEPTVSESEVKLAVKRALETYLAPVPPRDEKADPSRPPPEPWPFEQSLYVGRLYGEIFKVNDAGRRLVRTVTEVQVSEGGSVLETDKIDFTEDWLPACTVEVEVPRPSAEGR